MTDDPRVFESRESFREWLVQNHAASPGIWLMLGKTARFQTLSANEALEEALCFGWIDGQLRSIDAHRYRKRFTPRRDRSVWSERNRKIAGKLIEQGRMAAAGHAAIARAKHNGTWNRAEALAGTGKALANFLNMSPSVQRTYAMSYWDARKEDTRKRRLSGIIARLKENKKPM